MSGREVNGRRLEASFGPWSGIAGVQERARGLIDVAFRANLKDVRDEKTGVVDGQPVQVIKVAKGEFVAGLVVATCRQVSAGAS